VAQEKQKTMSQPYTITLPRQDARQALRRNQNTVRFKMPISLGPVSHTVLIALMLAVLGLVYLTQITKTSTFGYQLNDLTTKENQLASENSDLQVENARLQALERVQQSNVAKAMTTPAKTDYASTN
jgi:cell division protein FtsL